MICNPLQNDLSEFFALLDFANPRLLGTKAEFKKQFENTIVNGRNSDATDKQKEASNKKLVELGDRANKFVIRRTNDLLSKYRECPFFTIL